MGLRDKMYIRYKIFLPKFQKKLQAGNHFIFLKKIHFTSWEKKQLAPKALTEKVKERDSLLLILESSGMRNISLQRFGL